MAIFARRQLQQMLDVIGPRLKRGSDLLKRLDNTAPNQALPAEYELALGWAMSQVGDIEIEPSVGGKTPDFLVTGLFPGQSAIIEVAALSDEGLSGEASMERTANIVGNFANTVRKKAGDHLYFQFFERSGYQSGPAPGQIWSQSNYYRKRLTSTKFALTDAHKVQLREWMATWPPTTPLRIAGDETALEITWQAYVHPMARVFSSMPSVSHSLTDNPVYKKLEEKERRQVKIAGDGFMRCIFLGDAGCRMLRVPREYDPTNRVVSSENVIRHFLANSSVDLVAVFSPRRRNENALQPHGNPRVWHAYYYDRYARPDGFHDGLARVRDLLPKPYLHGYQARSWLRQGMLNPQGRGQYLPAVVMGGRDEMSIKMSARAIFELLAGRMSAAEALNRTTGGENLFELWLKAGHAVSNVRFEPNADGKDDDYVIFEFSKDANASPLVLNMPASKTDGGFG